METINGLIDTIEWDTVGETITAGVGDVLDFLIEATSQYNPEKIGNAIQKLVGNIDWGEIISKAYELAGTHMANKIKNLMFVGEKIHEGIQIALDYFKGKIEECGGNVFDGICTGILDGMVNIANWIKEHVFEPFIKGFKKAFDINSPSKVMEEQGKYIIEGLKNGILNAEELIKKAWNKVKTWFTDIVKNASVRISQKWSDIKDRWYRLTGNIKNKTAEMKARVANKWSDIKDRWYKLTGNIKNKSADMKAKIATKWNDIKDRWYKITDKIKNKTADMKAKIATRWDDIKQTWEGLLDNFKDKTIKIEAKISPIIDKVKGWLNTNFIDRVNEHIPEWIGHIPQLAKGNVAYEPLIAQFGEYSGARTNPEITTPQNIMRETFEGVLSKYATNNSGSFSVENKLIVNGKEIARQILDDLNDEARRRDYKPILQH